MTPKPPTNEELDEMQRRLDLLRSIKQCDNILCLHYKTDAHIYEADLIITAGGDVLKDRKGNYRRIMRVNDDFTFEMTDGSVHGWREIPEWLTV